jgi:transcriptional regulator with XRE-family HTH domain
MPESALGIWLRALREERQLSLRDLAKLGEVDHAYIYRLETGAKEAPSEDVINKLVTALALSERDADVFRFLGNNPNTDTGLVGFMRIDSSVTLDEFRMLTTVVNRGARPDFSTSLARIRRFMKEDDDG